MNPEELSTMQNQIKILQAKIDFLTSLVEYVVPLHSYNDLAAIQRCKKQIYSSYELDPATIKNS